MTRTARCWCGAPVERRPGAGRPSQFCSRAHYPSLQRAQRRRYRQDNRALVSRLDARAAALGPDAAALDSAGVITLTCAVYQQALEDDDRGWLADRHAQGFWAEILEVLRAATVTGMD